jgi:hypothetical protein
LTVLVLLRYQVTIRTYGAISTTFRHRLGWVANPPVNEPPRQALTSPPAAAESPGPCPTIPDRELGREAKSEEESDFAAKRRSHWARLIAKTYLTDPERCHSCGEPMKIVAALVSPHQDEAIEKILRHLNRWDPPWKRERKARGPPPGHRGPISSPQDEDRSPAGSIDPPWEDEV